MAKLTKPDPYCAFKDDRERSKTMIVRILCGTAVSLYALYINRNTLTAVGRLLEHMVK